MDKSAGMPTGTPSGSISEGASPVTISRIGDVALTDAIAAFVKEFGGGPAVVTARAFSGFAMVDGQGNIQFPGSVREPGKGEIFEIRLFCRDAELRWAGDAGAMNATGHAAIISEVERRSGDQWKNDCRNVYSREGQYLIWGEGRQAGATTGWSAVYDHRLGTLQVPFAGLTAGKRLKIRTREYFEPDLCRGNLAFVAERLTEIVQHE